MSFNRRQFLRTAAAAAGSTALVSTFSRQAFAQQASIRHFWWGNPDRDERTFEAIRIFNEKHPEIVVSGETLGAADYFTRLTTQIAGRNMADAIQMGYGVMFEYIDRGAILPLDEYIGGALDLSKFDESAIEAGRVDGKLYALSIGANSHVAMFNQRLFEEAGVEFDAFGWTYEDLQRIAGEVKAATGVFGSDDGTADYQVFSDYVHQRGERLFNEDGSFGASPEIIADYFNIWAPMRAEGSVPPGQESAGLVGAEISNWGVVTGQTAMSYAWSNQLVGVQNLMQDTLGAAMFPNTPEMIPGSIIQPSQFICLSRDTVDAEATVTYMSAFVNDPDMTAVLGLERGIPANSDVRAALQPNLTEIEATSVAFFDGIQGKTMELLGPPPNGAQEIEAMFERVAVAVLLEQGSIQDVANQIAREAEGIRRRSR